VRTGVVAIAAVLACAAPVGAEVSLDAFFPIVTRRPVIEHEVEMRATHEHRRDARDTAISLAVEGAVLPRWGVSLSVPVALTEPVSAPSTAGIGDVELETKLVLHAAGDGRAMVTTGLSLTLPTGSERRRLGGATVLEPFAAVGFAVSDVLIVSDVGYVVAVEGPQRDQRRLHAGLAVGRPVGRDFVPFLALTAASTLERGSARDDTRRGRVEVYLGPGLNVRILPRATLGLGAQFPLTPARVLDYALFTTIDWDL
jgi:hypothetical protein